MRNSIQVRHLETACPHHRFCLRDSDWVGEPHSCIIDNSHRGCPMYKDIEAGGSPWNWRVQPRPESKWWDGNRDEITARPARPPIKEKRLVEIEE